MVLNVFYTLKSKTFVYDQYALLPSILFTIFNCDLTKMAYEIVCASLSHTRVEIFMASSVYSHDICYCTVFHWVHISFYFQAGCSFFFPLLQFEEACYSSCLVFVEFGVTFLCLRIITFMADKLTIETDVNNQQIAVTIYMAITYTEMLQKHYMQTFCC